MGTNATIIEGAYAAFARGDIAGVIDLLDDDVEWSSPATLPQGGRFQGKTVSASSSRGLELVGARLPSTSRA